VTHRTFTRREMAQPLAAGMAAGARLLAGAAPAARCTVVNDRGEPLSTGDLTRFHVCDLLMRPFPIQPQFEPGAVAFEPPRQAFRIGLPLAVPGFGNVFVYANNRGRGYTARAFSQPLFLNLEFASDRLATVQGLLEECRRSNVTISAAARGRADKAKALLARAEALGSDRAAQAHALTASLSESLWAGELIAVERADQVIARRGARPGFLFGCNAFQYPEYGERYAEQFQAVFNFATVPFYRGMVEREQGHPDYSAPEKLLRWLGRTDIICKGHPLIFLSDSTPEWLRNLPYTRTKELCTRHVREAILRFRSRVHAWDVINEAHVQPEPETGMQGFTKEQNVELTAAALRAAREADPTCFRVVNSTGTWGDYYMGRKPAVWQQSVYDYLQMLQDARVEYEAIGLQYYHSGRDLLEFERDLETFQDFGKPVHITELGIPSSSDDVGKNEWWGGGAGGCRMVWHGERHTETAQADWVEQLYKIAFSKPYVEAITWWDLSDPAFVPHGGLLRADGRPKPAYNRLAALQAKWRREGVLLTAGQIR